MSHRNADTLTDTSQRGVAARLAAGLATRSGNPMPAFVFTREIESSGATARPWPNPTDVAQSYPRSVADPTIQNSGY